MKKHSIKYNAWLLSGSTNLEREKDIIVKRLIK